jgi:D-alanyl-D-alanine dipeptidase
MDTLSHKVPNGLPERFCFLKDIDPSIIAELKYATNDNFLGRPAKGYYSNTVITTIDAALCLKEAQERFLEFGYCIKVLDAYRPHTAVEDFWDWAHDKDDIKMKEMYYPKYDSKELLFSDGFIARYSKHSRGSAIDMTIVHKDTLEDVDMGSHFDFFSDESSTATNLISDEGRKNRELMVSVMEQCGFVNYHKEWWHFELVDEPYSLRPDHHFSAPIE